MSGRVISMAAALIAVFGLGAAGCDGDSSTDTDGGRADGSVSSMDGGVSAMDGGDSTDDGGGRPDGSTAADAGRGLDAGEGSDGAARADGGGATDDAGPRTDAATGTDGGAYGGDADAFLLAYTRALCEIFLDCESRFQPALAVYLEVICHSEILEVSLDDLRMAIAAGTVGLDAAAAADCVSGLSALSCADFVDDQRSLNRLCVGALTGTVSPGNACRLNEECTDGVCDLGGGCPGTCRALAGADAGCEVDAECQPSLVCVPSDAGNRCAERQGLGGDCHARIDCQNGLTCRGGRCEVAYGDGVTCNPNGDDCEAQLICSSSTERCVVGASEGMSCADGPCALGHRCNPSSMTCVALSPPGGSCSRDVECPVTHWCDGGTCEPLPVVGESCAEAPRCARGACREGTCTLLSTGSSCSRLGTLQSLFGQCEAGWCDAGECAPDRGLGGSCTYDEQCQSDLDCREAQCSMSCSL